ncbi:MAG: monophosphatase [Ilumatobacteraceae bacterium]|jgi:myo-inositol-1(or 4)-monophosphatase
MTDLHRQLRDIAARLAVAAGDLVFEGRKSGVASVSTKSSDTDVVTEFDRASERLIVDGLRAERPDDAVVGEEGTDSAGRSGIRWLIDPIDGTTNFQYDLPGYAVSIAALSGEQTVAGAVYIPSYRELYTAIAGEGALLNGEAIRCGTISSLDQALVATGFSYLIERRRAQALRIAEVIPRVRDIRRFGAAAPDLCFLAAGRLDVYFEQWLGPWDWAAGELIAREAGCRTGRFDGSPVGDGQVLAANPALFDKMVELLEGTEPGRNPGIM